MKKILILSFSGTGNTKYIANLIKNEFERKGNKVNNLNITKNFKIDLIKNIYDYDIIGFGYPTHAFGCPNLVYEFVDKIIPNIHASGFLFRTSGDPFLKGGSTKRFIKLLGKKWINIEFEELFIMPANVLMKFPSELIKQLYLIAQKEVLKFVEEILNEENSLIKYSRFNNFISRIFNNLERRGAKKFAKKIKITENCNLCELCINSCPSSNISIESNQVTFGDDCEFCMRCIYICPNNALKNNLFSIFIINEGFSQKENLNILNNPDINSNFLNKKTKGFFKHYYKYFKKKSLIN